ncbi:guanylate kinase [uncultured Vagococcus sp.]|uniref:guanylate kinase n=1 Tax=uncultured Vagococcus sp. TaxID=189676 RepID=UPI0028D4E1B8|nr:guanylate kinase [uncultured Vagococcus sp.]
MINTGLKHSLFVIIGPSGSGKTRVTEAVFPKQAKIITHTTRPIRQEEREGIDYYFETENSFQKLFQSGQLVEQDRYHGFHYGVGLAEISKRTASQPAYAVLTYSGLKEVYRHFPEDVIVIFFDVTKEHVQHRLALREQDSKLIQERLTLYDQEILIRDQLEIFAKCYMLDANQPFNEVVTQFSQILTDVKKNVIRP